MPHRGQSSYAYQASPHFDLDQGRYFATPLTGGVPPPVRIQPSHEGVTWVFIRQTLETSFRASTPARSCQKRPPLKQNTHIGHGACCSTAVAANSMWNATWPAVHSIKAGTQKSVTACACQVPKCRAPERGQRGPSKTPHAPTPSSTWNLALA